ncbi:hypothetical protein MWU50_00165 [Flavobacteriaceae bacterium S0862]|nr:hypothetical protein [Flavobacteriaceae bacterium S0862]
MKKFIIIIVFCISNLGFSQFNQDQDYDIFLLLDSEKKEMLVNSSFIENDLIIRTYIISKNIPKEKGEHISFRVNEKGKIYTAINGANHVERGKLVLIYGSPKHSKKKFLKIKDLNIISYEDILNTNFKSFLKLLGEATNIYVIDAKDVKDNELYYTAYEVSF